jgi:hypothetical protein
VYFVRSGQIRCAIPVAERVLDWQAGNRCKHFEFQDVSSESAQAAVREVAVNGNGRTPKDRWEQLFSKL